MPVTIPTQFKLTQDDRDRLDELGRIWGIPGQPLTMVDAVKRAIYQAWEAETQRGKKQKNPKNSGSRVLTS